MSQALNHNWPQIIKDLEASGLTMYKIALAMNQAGLKAQYGQVKRWANGSEPRASHARFLEYLHIHIVPRETLQK